MPDQVTVAIPTRNAGALFEQVVEAVRGQRLQATLELMVCDSGSTDETPAIARAHGAQLIEIPPGSFSHGATRNLMMARAQGEYVAFLTQDAIPADRDWLARLLDAFALAPNVGLVFGPYRPRPEASLSVARELTAWFQSFSADGRPRIDALPAGARDVPAARLLGHVGYFTDANGCVARTAWERVPFRAVPYAEDHLLAHDMLRAGFAKVYEPRAAVVHSHEYDAWGWLRRSFDEARAMREIYGWSIGAGEALRDLRGNVAADRRWARELEAGGRASLEVLARSLSHHGPRAVGRMLGGRAHRLPAAAAARLSLEGRS